MRSDVVPLNQGLRKRLAKLGANVSYAAAAARLDASETTTTQQFFTFWHALGETSAPDIGLRLATLTQVHEYDVSGMAAMCSPDVLTALEKTARYKRLCGPKDLSIEPAGKEVVIYTTWQHAQRNPPARLVDASLASELVLLQRGTGRAIAPKRLELSRARSDEPMLMRFFGCPLRFKAKHDALVLDRSVLELPFVTHNAGVLAALIPGLDAELSQLDSHSFVASVEAVVARRMAGEKPSVEKVARELSLSPRTLQRRLGEEGLSYQQLLDTVRHKTALELLRAAKLEIAEVAFLLGFEELNSFTRAFRGWEGVTPKRWRDSMS